MPRIEKNIYTQESSEDSIYIDSIQLLTIGVEDLDEDEFTFNF